MLKDLIKLADSLDRKGLAKESDILDRVIQKVAQMEIKPKDNLSFPDQLPSDIREALRREDELFFETFDPRSVVKPIESEDNQFNRLFNSGKNIKTEHSQKVDSLISKIDPKSLPQEERSVFANHLETFIDKAYDWLNPVPSFITGEIPSIESRLGIFVNSNDFKKLALKYGDDLSTKNPIVSALLDYLREAADLQKDIRSGVSGAWDNFDDFKRRIRSMR
jgi:hypothetical protein